MPMILIGPSFSCRHFFGYDKMREFPQAVEVGALGLQQNRANKTKTQIFVEFGG